MTKYATAGMPPIQDIDTVQTSKIASVGTPAPKFVGIGDIFGSKKNNQFGFGQKRLSKMTDVQFDELYS